ncbi:restriction endonuclease subunit S [Shewanella algae]|uniref:restriction endonuclease subunit S n=1 Tax=Shewanella algae TaxID=38313 RepID=UPI003AACF965
MTNFSGKPLSPKTGNAACGGPQGGGMDGRRNGVAEISPKYLAEVASNAVPVGYKQTEVGVIPEDWECIPSKEIVSYLGGFAFSSKAATTDGIRWLKIANVGLNEVKWDAESYLPASYSQVHQDYLLGESDVVMALTRPILGETLKVAILNETDAPALLNQRVAKLVPKNAGDQRFLYYLVQTSNFIAAMNLAMAGSDPPNIGTRALGDILVQVPKLPKEQTAIANALSDVDALISELEKLIAKKQAIKTATMQQLLTGRTRLPQFALRQDGTPKGTKPSELGEIPEDWEVYRFDQNFTIYAGGDVPKDSFSKIKTDTYPYPIFANAIQGRGLYGYTSHSRSKPNSVTITARGYLGHAEYRNEPFFPIVRLLVMEPVGSVDSRFATYAINELVEFPTESTGVPQLTAPQVGKFSISAPVDVNEQTEIATILSDMDAEIQAQEQRLGKIRQIKQGMMQELLTGKTRLIKPSTEVIHE